MSDHYAGVMARLGRSRRPRTLVMAAVAALLGAITIGITAVDRPGRDPDRIAAQAREALAARRWAHAESLLDRLARLRDGHAADALLRAELERSRGRSDAALALLAAIPDTDSLAAQARLRAGQIERDRARIRWAEAAFLAALQLDPTLIQARRELVYLYGMQARRDELHDQFRALAELMPLNHQDMLLWTVSHEDIWANDTIRADLERFLAADPADRWSRLALAEVLRRSGDLEACEVVLRDLPATDIEARVLRARLALDRSQIDEARTLVADGPAEHAGLALLRGNLAIRAQNPAAAAEQFRIAARLEPTAREAHHGLSLALKLLGDETEAAACSQQAERLRALAVLLERSRTPEGRQDPALIRQLGAACEAVGQLDEARGWYRLAITINPLDDEAQRALYRLRDLSE